MATEEMGDGSNIQCTNHPYRRNSAPGGICALCLQEKLGNLLSSSFSLPFLPSSSSPSSCSSPSFTSHPKHQQTNTTIVFKRTQSTATPRRRPAYFLNGNGGPRSRFWSFLHTPSSKKPKPNLEEERKVSRSRSVGCGSRSFSGDLFERISSGFGDCTTLRRVESQREGKPNINNGGSESEERVRCGGIFGGFIITSSSSSTTSSSSSSNLQVSEDNNNNSNVKRRNWRWALPSPMRVLGGKKLNKNQPPILGSIPVTG